MGWQNAAAEEARKAAERWKAHQKEAHARAELEKLKQQVQIERKACEEAKAKALAAKRREENLDKQNQAGQKAQKEAWAEAKKAKEEADAASKREKRAKEEAARATEIAETTRIALEKAKEETRKAKEAAERGIAPILWPTPEEYDAAKKIIQNEVDNLHFAVCGSAGSGKSSLINALRGVLNNEDDSADVDTVETTLEIGRYPDLRSEFPFNRFVWYDIPGAGTLTVPDWQYFINQKLFIFDLIILVYDIRFTKIDAGIIESCLRFNIPVFVVRSKADQHIWNMTTDADRKDPANGDQAKIEEREKLYRQKHIDKTQKDFQKNLRQMVTERHGLAHPRLLTQEVYIISSHVLHKVVNTGLGNIFLETGETPGEIIDEKKLIKDMAKVGYARTLNLEKAKEVIERVFKPLGSMAIANMM